MVKILIGILISIYSVENINAQGSINTETVNQVILKSKLLTISQYGLNDINGIIKDRMNLKDSILFMDSGYVVVQILDSSNFKSHNTKGVSEKLRPYCEFIIVYSINTHKFYKIKGFRLNDFGFFQEELKRLNGINYYNFVLRELISNYNCLELGDIGCEYNCLNPFINYLE